MHVSMHARGGGEKFVLTRAPPIRTGSCRRPDRAYRAPLAAFAELRVTFVRHQVRPDANCREKNPGDRA